MKMNTKQSILIFVRLLGLYTMISCSKEQDLTPVNDKYFPQVKKIIENNCLVCHSSTGTWEGRPVSFDSDSAISEQYTFIKAAVADPVTITNKRMPQGGSLSASDIAIIVKWFNKGGKTTD
jgi:uncharacterized membrane protein